MTLNRGMRAIAVLLMFVAASACEDESGSSSSLAAKNEALVMRYVEEIINQKNYTSVDELISDSMVIWPGMPGKQGVKDFNGAVASAFPNFHATVKKVVADDESVAIYVTFTGTNDGDFSLINLKKTGNAVAFDEIMIFGVKDGKLESRLNQADFYGMLTQLEAVPMWAEACTACAASVP